MTDNNEILQNETELTVEDETQRIARSIMEEKDPDKAKDLVSLFNWNMSKKNTSRILKLNNLYDDVTDQMVIRFKTKADQFTNSDLLDYMKTLQGAIDNSTKNLLQVDETPVILQQQNTQINVNVSDTFDRDAKSRILEAIQKTLDKANDTVVKNTEEDMIDADKVIDELSSVTKENDLE